MNKDHLISLYRLLGHKDYWSRMGSLDFSIIIKDSKTGQEKYLYEEEYVYGEDKVLEYASRFDGKRNIFISRSARNEDGSVHHCRVITFDLDPIRDKGTASTPKQHENAINAGQRILSLYPGGYLASSGNGCLLLYYSSSFVDITPDYYSRESVLIKELQNDVNRYEIKIDATHYPTAVIKAIGTTSTKGRSEDRRQARFFAPVISPYRNCTKLLERLTAISPVKSVSRNVVDVQRLQSGFNGDRSIADYRLVSYLKQSGVKPEDALQALKSNPLGRQIDEKDQARLIGKIYGAVDGVTSDGTESYFDKLFQKDREDGKALGSGFPSLDKETGMFPRGELVTFAARSGYGKSTFSCSVSENLRRIGKKVLYFSTEMHRDYIMHKFVSIACSIPLNKMVQKDLTDEEGKRIREYEKQLLRTSIEICDDSRPSIEKVRNEIIKHKPDLVVVDHITYIETHWEKLAEYTKLLKALVKEQDTCCLVTVMLNEPPRGKNGEDMTSVRGDVRGTKEILNTSAIMVLMTNPFVVKSDRQPVEFHIAKSRYGLSGQVVTLNLDKRVSKFYE